MFPQYLLVLASVSAGIAPFFSITARFVLTKILVFATHTTEFMTYKSNSYCTNVAFIFDFEKIQLQVHLLTLFDLHLTSFLTILLIATLDMCQQCASLRTSMRKLRILQFLAMHCCRRCELFGKLLTSITHSRTHYHHAFILIISFIVL